MSRPVFMRRRLLPTAAATILAAGACILGTVQADAAQAAQPVPALAQYTAAVTPGTVPVGSSSTISVTIADVAGSLGTIGSASVKLPASFTNISAPTKVVSSAGAAWGVSISGTTVKLKTNGLLGIGSLVPGRSVTVPITVKATAAGSFTLTTGVAVSVTGTDLVPIFKLKGAAPTVLAQVAGTPCPAGQSCTTPAGSLVGTTPGGQTDSFTITADPGPTAVSIVAAIQYPDATHRLLCQSENVNHVLVFDVPGRSKTIVDSRTNNFVGEGANNSICYGSDNPFYVLSDSGPVTADFNPANGQYEGPLLPCNELTDVGIPATNPCVDSYQFNDDGSVITVKAPAGDPKVTA